MMNPTYVAPPTWRAEQAGSTATNLFIAPRCVLASGNLDNFQGRWSGTNTTTLPVVNNLAYQRIAGAGIFGGPAAVYTAGYQAAIAALLTQTGGTLNPIPNPGTPGHGYLFPPPVSINGGGGTGIVGTLTAVGGAVTSVGIITGGAGWVVGMPVLISGGGATGATGTIATVSGSAAATITVNPGSTGYPTVSNLPATIVYQGATAQATLTGDTVGGIVKLTDSGTFTSNPTMTIGYPLVQAVAVAPLAASGGGIQTPMILTGGFGYSSPPPVSFVSVDGAGSGAAATPVLTNGVITGWTGVVAGSAYKLPPQMIIGAPTGSTGVTVAAPYFRNATGAPVGVPVTAGQWYTWTGYIKADPAYGTLVPTCEQPANIQTQVIVPADGTWHRLRLTFQPTTSANVIMRLTSSVTAVPIGARISTDCFQLEAGLVPTSYFDGTLGPSYAWTGAPWASTSTRTSPVTTLVAGDGGVSNSLHLGSLTVRGTISSASLAYLFNVKDPRFGAIGDGVADDTAAIQAAITAAQAAAVVSGAAVFFPRGTYIYTQQLRIGTCWLVGESAGASVLKYTGTSVPSLASIAKPGVNATWQTVTVPSCATIIVAGSRPACGIRDMGFLGPLPTPIPQSMLGVRQNYPCGICITGTGLECVNLNIAGFDVGIVTSSASGHNSLINISVNTCYYGFYSVLDGGNLYIGDSTFNANAMAGMAWTDCNNAAGASGLIMRQVFVTNNPYGLYQEFNSNGYWNPAWLAGTRPSPAATWLTECDLSFVRFETCGNGAIYSEYAAIDQVGPQPYNIALGLNPAYVATPDISKTGGSVALLNLQNLGASYTAGNRINARPKDYMILTGPMIGPNKLGFGAPSGAIGMWWSPGVSTLSSNPSHDGGLLVETSFSRDTQDPHFVVFAVSTARVGIQHRPIGRGSLRGTDTISAGTSFKTVTVPYCMSLLLQSTAPTAGTTALDASMIFPVVTPTAAGTVPIYVDPTSIACTAPSANSTGTTTFIVRMGNGANAAADVTFFWSLD